MKSKFILFVFAILFTQAASATPINVSCTDSVKSLNKTATTDFEVMCPVNCMQGSVWGSDVYTTDSAICVSAVHAGIIKEQGGLVKVQLAPGQDAYAGLLRNGVTTQSWGKYEQSFKVAK